MRRETDDEVEGHKWQKAREDAPEEGEFGLRREGDEDSDVEGHMKPK